MTLPLEPSIAAAVGGMSMLFLIAGWIEENNTAPEGVLKQALRTWRCQICAAFYQISREERLTICPQCGSYNSSSQ